MAECASIPLVGRAGEAFVECDLLRRGVQVHRTSPGSGYDLVADHDGRLFRVEVKTTAGPVMKRKGGGSSQIVYRFPFAKDNREKYLNVEVFAFVALDQPAVIYVPWCDVGLRTSHKDFSMAKIACADESFAHCFGNAVGPVEPEPDAEGKIVALDVLTGQTKEFASVAEAVGMGFTASGVSSCLNGKLRTHRGHSFRRICG